MNITVDSRQPTSTSISSAMDAFRVVTAILGIFIYAAGFLGNFFSLLLFIQKELRQVSTGLLFLLLNIMSTVHLLSLIVEFLDSIFQIQVVPSGVFRCQFILWLQNASRTMCSFLATTVSVDRFVRSQFPIPSRLWCTPKNVIKLSIIYTLFSILLYLFFFYPLNLFDANGNCSFSYNALFRLFAVNVMPPVRFLFICVIPAILMLGCGGRMLYNIRQSRKRISQLTAMHTTTAATIANPTSKPSSTTGRGQRQKIAVDNMLLLMVLANISAYIITQIPFNTYTVYYGYDTTADYYVYSLTRSFLLTWSSIYFGVGFYLFCIASPQFRKQSLTKLRTLCCCWRSSQRQMTSSKNN